MIRTYSTGWPVFPRTDYVFLLQIDYKSFYFPWLNPLNISTFLQSKTINCKFWSENGALLGHPNTIIVVHTGDPTAIIDQKQILRNWIHHKYFQIFCIIIHYLGRSFLPVPTIPFFKFLLLSLFSSNCIYTSLTFSLFLPFPFTLFSFSFHMFLFVIQFSKKKIYFSSLAFPFVFFNLLSLIYLFLLFLHFILTFTCFFTILSLSSRFFFLIIVPFIWYLLI